MRAYFGNLATITSQGLHALIGGNPDLTLSARLYIEASLGNASAARWVRRINAAFWWQDDHCRASWMRDVRHAGLVLRLQRQILRRAGRGE